MYCRIKVYSYSLLPLWVLKFHHDTLQSIRISIYYLEQTQSISVWLQLLKLQALLRICCLPLAIKWQLIRLLNPHSSPNPEMSQQFFIIIKTQPMDLLQLQITSTSPQATSESPYQSRLLFTTSEEPRIIIRSTPRDSKYTGIRVSRKIS